jgi:hypothetical protein
MIACRTCGVVHQEPSQFCSNCGAALAVMSPAGRPPLPTWTDQSAKASNDKQGLAVAGLVCGITALLILPIVLGPLGIIFGAISWRAGNRLGLSALIVSVITMPLGMLIGAMVMS